MGAQPWKRCTRLLALARMGNPGPIGVFDSGMGGLTVLAELVRLLPEEQFIYLGDTARVPYGSRSPRTVQRYSREVAGYLTAQNIKMLVIACNTATAYAEDLLRSSLSVPVLGVIRPGVAALLARTKNRKVGVIGTRATIKSAAYEKQILEKDPGIKVYSKACPLFVPLVEEGWVDKKVTSLAIQEYLSELVREEVDTLILGCTHYPLLKKSIQHEFPGLDLVDSSIEIARAVKHQLAEKNLTAPASASTGSVRILLTDVTEQMEQLEKLFFGMTFRTLEEIQISED